MCGIVAMYAQGGALNGDRLTRAVDALEHRGPDGRRVHIDMARGVGLAHARLSIVDPEGGAQPIANEDESIWAAVNGEFYDFERIRQELLSMGHRFRTGSDSEIVLHLYEQYGPSCVDHLRGEFAFALYDAKNDLLFAARDRFGIKPLCYAIIDGVLTVASEAKALFAAGLRARWDRESFFQSTASAGPLEDRTWFQDVQQLPAGFMLMASRGQTRTVRYWDLDYPELPHAVPRTEEQDAAALREVLDEAVRLRLRADVPVGCYLSGGIDSCLVLALAAQHSSTPIRTFTLKFADSAYDESAIAEEMARRVGAEHSVVPITDADLADDFEDALYFAERPFINANSVAKFRLSRATRDAGIKVVLTGEGSDEIFAGYPHYRRDLLLCSAQAAESALGKLDRDSRVSRGILLPHGEGNGSGGAVKAIGFTPTWMAALATLDNKMRGLFSEAFASEFGARDTSIPFFGTIEVGRRLRGRHPVHQAMYLWSKAALPNFVLSVLGDRMEMAHSVEGRLPFLDHRVVEFASTITVDRLIRGSVEKYLLREVARPLVTDTVYRRQKHPFLAPPAISGACNELLQDTLRAPSFKDVPFFDQARVVRLLDALPKLDLESQTAIDTPLMLVLSTALMQSRFQLAN